MSGKGKGYGKDGYKVGNWSKDEIEYIKLNYRKKSLDELAGELERNPKTLKAWCRKNLEYDEGDVQRELENNFAFNVRTTPEFLDATELFSEQELKFYEWKFLQTAKQFKEDMTPTEITQIHQMIRYELMMRRSLKEQKDADDERAKTNEYIHKLREMDDGNDPELRGLILDYTKQLQGFDAASRARLDAYHRMATQHAKLMDDLKATRKARIDKIEGSSQRFIDVLKEMELEDRRKAAGEFLELAKRATAKEYKRLGAPHTYLDGSVDRPLLTNETVMENQDAPKEDEA